jgi:rhodanese-related sulfurtransferase
VTSKPDSWFITEEEFEDRFGFERPGKEKEVVFYCKAGVRSRTAAEFARQGGWENVSEYPGSWLDWEKNGGEREGGQS